MILALCPGRVTSNILAKVAGGNAPLSISLTVVTSLLSILTVPLMVAFSVHHFMGEDGPPVNVTQLGITMFLITAVPVAIGMALTAKSPALVEKIAPGVSRAALVLFVPIIVAALAKNWGVFSSNLGTLGPVAVLLNVVMLGAGVVSAKALRLDRRDATTISIESGVQNGTLAIAIGKHRGIGRRPDLASGDRPSRRLQHHHVFRLRAVCPLATAPLAIRSKFQMPRPTPRILDRHTDLAWRRAIVRHHLEDGAIGEARQSALG